MHQHSTLEELLSWMAAQEGGVQLTVQPASLGNNASIEIDCRYGGKLLKSLKWVTRVERELAINGGMTQKFLQAVREIDEAKNLLKTPKNTL